MLEVKRGDTVFCTLGRLKKHRKFKVIGLAEPLPFMGGVTKAILQHKSKFYEVSINEIKIKV